MADFCGMYSSKGVFGVCKKTNYDQNLLNVYFVTLTKNGYGCLWKDRMGWDDAEKCEKVESQKMEAIVSDFLDWQKGELFNWFIPCFISSLFNQKWFWLPLTIS